MTSILSTFCSSAANATEENKPVVATLVAATANKLRRIALAVNVTELMNKLPITWNKIKQVVIFLIMNNWSVPIIEKHY